MVLTGRLGRLGRIERRERRERPRQIGKHLKQIWSRRRERDLNCSQCGPKKGIVTRINNFPESKGLLSYFFHLV